MTEPARTASIAIAGDRIVAIEDAVVEAMIGPETTVVDVEGRTVMPGLVDAHSHFYNTAAQDGIGPQIAELILSSGITTTAELAVDPSLLATIQGWADDDLLRVRTSVYLLYDDACGSDLGDWWRDVAPTREPGEMFRIGGLKLFLDGGSCNVPAVTYTYSDGSSGDLYFDVEQLVGVLDEVEAAGRQIVMHALGDRAVRTALDAFDQAVPAGNPNRHRIDHNAVVAPELRGRYDGSGAVAALFGAYSTCFVTNGAGDFKFRTPPEFLEWEWPWRAVLDQNPQTHFAWHADYPVLDPSIGRTLEGFVTRSDGDCVAPPDVAVNAITAEEALELMTLGSAYALDRDTEVGSLDVGKFADLIVLDRDPLWSPLEDLAGTSVVAAYVGGNAEYCADDVANWCD